MLESALKAAAADIAAQASVGPNPAPGGPPVTNSLSPGLEPYIVERVRKMLGDELPLLRAAVAQEISKLKDDLAALPEEAENIGILVSNLFFDTVQRIDQHLLSYHRKQADPASN
jgi:hypothetical protein